MKILVTGSQGYVGTELMKKLHFLGIDVIGIDIGFFRNEITPTGFTQPRKC